MISQEIMQSQSVLKLTGLLQRRYGLGLKIKRLHTFDLSESTENSIIKNGDLYIPLAMNETYLGQAIVTYGAHINPVDQQTLHHMVKMVLEPVMYKWFLNQKSLNMVHQMNVQNQIESAHDKEIFVEFRNNELSEQLKPESRKRSIHFLYLAANEQTQILRTVDDLHEISGLWAKLEWKDIQSQIMTLDDLINLGSVALWIESIWTLADHHRKIVMDFMNQVPDEDSSLVPSCERPLLIVSDLFMNDDQARVHETTADQTLFKKLKMQEIKIQSLPVDRKERCEVLDMLLF